MASSYDGLGGREQSRTETRKGRAGGKVLGLAKDGSFELDESKYDPNDFYTGSTNSHDHSVRVTVKMPSHLLQILSRLVADPSYPAIKTHADAFRDALVHRAMYFQQGFKLPAEMEGWVASQISLGKLAQIKAEKTTNLEVIEEYRSSVDIAITERDIEMMQVLIRDAEMYLMHAREPHRGAILQILDNGARILGMDRDVIAELAADTAPLENARVAHPSGGSHTAQVRELPRPRG